MFEFFNSVFKKGQRLNSLAADSLLNLGFDSTRMITITTPAKIPQARLAGIRITYNRSRFDKSDPENWNGLLWTFGQESSLLR